MRLQQFELIDPQGPNTKPLVIDEQAVNVGHMGKRLHPSNA